MADRKGCVVRVELVSSFLRLQMVKFEDYTARVQLESHLLQPKLTKKERKKNIRTKNPSSWNKRQENSRSIITLVLNGRTSSYEGEVDLSKRDLNDR